MTFDHRTTTIHRADLDREIDALRTERALSHARMDPGVLDRARRATGRLLIIAGEALAGRDERRLRAHRV
jgi:hypothetical protein